MSKSHQVGLVVTLVAVSVISYLSRTLMSIAGPKLMSQFGLSETSMGAVYSAFLLGYAAFMIPGGYLVDRLGPRRVLGTVILLMGLLTGLTALAGLSETSITAAVWPWLLTVRFVLGACSAPIYPAAAKANASWLPRSKAAGVQGWIAAGAGIGGALSPLLFAPFAAGTAWRTPFVLCALSAAVLAAAWLLLTPQHTRGQKNAQQTDWGSLLSNRPLLLLTASYFAVCYFEYIFFFWLYYYFGQVRGFSPAQTNIATTGLFVSWAIMTPFGGWIADRLTPRLGFMGAKKWVCAVALSASAVLLLGGTTVQSREGSMLMMALALGSAAASDGPFWAAVIHSSRGQTGAASGILNTGGNLGGVFAPVLTPWIAAWAGWSASLYVASAIVLAGVALWFAADRTANRSSTDACKLEIEPVV